MEHNPHNMQIHWDYTESTDNTWVPPPVKKRALSDSDCDDVYSEESSKEHYELIAQSNGEPTGNQVLSRKRRRGVIEKKRRDKINSSLSELKRLVPTAYEKQGSAKLEKAEILQLTVDHLKSLHSKGMDSLAIDPQRFAMDYHIIGFRECAAEVARYLVTIEGMDIQDPLRLRLMSHLQCFVAQRELSAKNTPNTSNWSTGNYQTPPPSTYPPPPATYHQNYPPQTTTSNSYIPNISSPIPITPIQQHCNSSSLHPNTSPSQSTNTQPNQIHPHTTNHHHHHHPNTGVVDHYPLTHDSQHGPVYADLSASISRGGPTSISLGYGNPQYPPSSAQGYPPHSASSTSPVNYNGNSMKPYRPWGAEMAY